MTAIATQVPLSVSGEGFSQVKIGHTELSTKRMAAGFVVGSGEIWGTNGVDFPRLPKLKCQFDFIYQF